MDGEIKTEARSSIKTRVFAFVTLCSFVSGVGYVGREAYRAATDSFVAPIILSPDSDLVLNNKLKMAELLVERTKSKSELEILDADITACDKALGRLAALAKTASGGLEWAKTVNAQQTTTGAAELAKLAEQNQVLSSMIAKQRAMAASTKRDMEAGLVSKTDYEKELQATNQMELALLENERTRLTSGLQIQQAMLVQQSLARANGAPTMPDALFREDQLVRVELDTIKLEAEKRAKMTERTALVAKVAKIDEMEAQLKSRPAFRAVDHSMDVAFVPYTQFEGVTQGAPVLDCIWGAFACKPVGTVAEIVPGEVVLPDPWGNQARGQYLVLDLAEHGAARSKTLRVRPSAPPKGKTATASR